MREQEAKDEIARILSPLPPKSQKRVAKIMLKKYQRDLGDLNLGIVETNKQLDDAIVKLHAFEGLKEWAEIEHLQLEKNECSRLHKMVEAIACGNIIDLKGAPIVPANLDIKHTFVVKHDWSAALGAIDGDEIKLPYELCTFEFRISGKTVIAIAVECDERPEGMMFTVLVESDGFWCPICDSVPKTKDILSQFVWGQITAICVALDAEVAIDEVQRSPYKLNQKREKAGKKPLADFHVVDLAKRHRVSNPSYGESGTKKRLHFRRGHWRHYDGFKTWVKWCLVGDPDLGFISKNYTI